MNLEFLLTMRGVNVYLNGRLIDRVKVVLPPVKPPIPHGRKGDS